MYSRAHLLIEQGFDTLKEKAPWGISAEKLNSDNMFEWMVKLKGPRGSVWEGGTFKVYMKFDEYYDESPPFVSFQTIPFHPNVDMITGQPCLDILTNWKKGCSVYESLIALQNLLPNPAIQNAVNEEAAKMLVEAPHSYKQMAYDCVTASQRIEAGLTPHFEHQLPPALDRPILVEKAPKPTPNIKPKSISFEDYHTTWVDIATSKSRPDITNNLLESIKNKPGLQTVHHGRPPEQLEIQKQRQEKEHKNLMYGRVKSKQQEDTDQEITKAKLEKINQMKKIYMQVQTPSQSQKKLADSRLHGIGGENEEWEEEVDDLVAWTNKLDDKML